MFTRIGFLAFPACERKENVRGWSGEKMILKKSE